MTEKKLYQDFSVKEKKIKNFGFVSRKLGLPLSEINKLSQAINGTGGVIKIIGGNVRDLLEKKKNIFSNRFNS